MSMLIPFQSILDKCPTRLPPRLKWCPEESTLSWLSFQTGARSNGRSRSEQVFGIEEDIEVCHHLVVRPVGKVGRVHLVFALSAGEALPVVAPWLRDLLLRLKHLEQQLFVKLGSLVPIFHLSRASRADVCTTFLALKLGAVGLVQGCLRLVPVGVRVAVLAVDLGNQGSDGDVMQDVTHIVVWSLGQRLVVQRAFALHALKTLAVVRTVPSSKIF